MVTIARITELAEKYRFFFRDVITAPKTKGDSDRATLGFEVANELLAFLQTKKDPLKNSDYKFLHQIFFDLTRGVEFFEEARAEEKNRQLGEKLVKMREEFLPLIKW